MSGDNDIQTAMRIWQAAIEKKQEQIVEHEEHVQILQRQIAVLQDFVATGETAFQNGIVRGE